MIEKIIALICLIILLPLLIAVGMLIKLSSRGPIFFKQKRVGQNKKTFIIYKFRTMKHNASETQHEQYIKHCLKQGSIKKMDNSDKRITWLGRFLRKSHIDELPQLINIIKGEMSFIGPRPCLPFEVVLYPSWSHKRFNIKPGITGLWQVNHSKKYSITDKLLYDIEYVNKRSFRKNISIIIKTFPTLIK